jgi:drug/metabolite transporter (DMT)-like permease
MRASATRVNAKMSMLAANYLVCALLGACYAGFDLIVPHAGFGTTVWLGVLSGVLYLLGFVAFQANTRSHGIVLTSVFSKLGLLVPMVVSLVLFREVPSISQWVGFCIAIAAIVLVNWQKGGAAKGFGISLLVMLLFNGGADTMSKVYEFYGDAAFENLFLFVTFFGALLQCLIYLICKKERIGWKELGYGTLLGVPNYLSTLFLLKSLSSVPAVIAFPTYSVGVILVVAVTGIVIFREKLEKKQIFGGILICIALALLNL